MKEGIVLAVEKLVHSKLLVAEGNRRIQTVDRHIGLVSCTFPIVGSLILSFWKATAGLLADGRHLANRARDEALNYRDLYRSAPPAKVHAPDRTLPSRVLTVSGIGRSFRSVRAGLYPIFISSTVWYKRNNRSR